MLPQNEFKQLLKLGSLFSLDLILFNEREEVLLGLRKNSPAKGCWFVPGSRTFKNETLAQAIKRITLNEIGTELTKQDLKPIGIYDHIYQDNFFEEKKISTHYIVLACSIRKKVDVSKLPLIQNEKMEFFSIPRLLDSNDVHRYTKNYFIDSPDNIFIKF